MAEYDNWDDDSEGGQTGQGGKTDEKGFRFKTEIFRDDQLPPAELKRLLEMHEDVHKAYVEKQKLIRKERQLIKEGRKDLLAQHRIAQGMGGSGGTTSRYKKHPISNKAQFSGIDKQVTAIPSENEAKTNDELRNNLENRYNYRFQPTRQFNPKPRPY